MSNQGVSRILYSNLSICFVVFLSSLRSDNSASQSCQPSRFWRDSPDYLTPVPLRSQLDMTFLVPILSRHDISSGRFPYVVSVRTRRYYARRLKS